jgi:hypothetical protein
LSSNTRFSSFNLIINMNIIASLLVSLAVLLALTSSATAQSTQCSICQFAVQYVDGFLQQNLTETQIIALLQAVCNLAPQGAFRTECDNLAQTYVPALINAIVNGVSPQEVCSVVGLCSSPAARLNTNAVTAQTHKTMTLLKVN